MCMQGREAIHNNSFPNINPNKPVITKLNQDVSSSSAYLPYTPRIMCMPKNMERKDNPKRLNNRT